MSWEKVDIGKCDTLDEAEEMLILESFFNDCFPPGNRVRDWIWGIYQSRGWREAYVALMEYSKP